MLDQIKAGLKNYEAYSRNNQNHDPQAFKMSFQKHPKNNKNNNKNSKSSQQKSKSNSKSTESELKRIWKEDEESTEFGYPL